MRGAAGITVITEELNEFNLAGRPHHVARPGDRLRALPARTSSRRCAARRSASAPTSS